jgi:hypothetical protein
MSKYLVLLVAAIALSQPRHATAMQPCDGGPFDSLTSVASSLSESDEQSAVGQLISESIQDLAATDRLAMLKDRTIDGVVNLMKLPPYRLTMADAIAVLRSDDDRLAQAIREAVILDREEKRFAIDVPDETPAPLASALSNQEKGKTRQFTMVSELFRNILNINDYLTRSFSSDGKLRSCNVMALAQIVDALSNLPIKGNRLGRGLLKAALSLSHFIAIEKTNSDISKTTTMQINHLLLTINHFDQQAQLARIVALISTDRKNDEALLVRYLEALKSEYGTPRYFGQGQVDWEGALSSGLWALRFVQIKRP